MFTSLSAIPRTMPVTFATSRIGEVLAEEARAGDSCEGRLGAGAMRTVHGAGARTMQPSSCGSGSSALRGNPRRP